MISKELLQEKLDFYENELKHNFLPFYMTHSIDYVNGGYYSCFTNDGSQLVSKNKYMWSQGRFIWIFSKLAEMENREENLELAKIGVDFVLKHGFLPDGRCVFLMDEQGTGIENAEGELAGSTFADCYVASGLALYAQMANDHEVMKVALDLYDNIMKLYQEETFQTKPFYVPSDMKCHLIPMILCGMHRDYVESLKAWNHPRLEELKKGYQALCDEIMDCFRQENNLILEMVGKDNLQRDRFLGRYVNVGHATEGLWFILHEALTQNNQNRIKEVDKVLKQIAIQGWDNQYGGFYYYIGPNGGSIGGAILDSLEEGVAAQMKQDSNNKLWWVHTESLYAYLLHGLTQEDNASWDTFLKLESYIFQTFPNPNKKIGEWIFLRKQNGEPLSGEVGGRLPIKDPFHPVRNIIMIIELLKKYINL